MNKIYLLIGVLLGLLVLIFILQFLGLFILIAAFLGVSIFIAYIIFIALFGIITILAIPYYLIKNKTEVDEYGSYDLEDFK